jgi:RNA polymerase sigma-70 factor (ECF subfamily)
MPQSGAVQLDTARKKQPTYVDDIAAASGPTPSPLEAAESRERDEAVRQALNTLPPNQRMAVVLAYYEGLRGREIAAAMKVSPKAVERLLARARKALAVRLEGFLEK